MFKILFSIARGVGVPRSLNDHIVSCACGFFARILVNINLKRKLLEQVWLNERVTLSSLHPNIWVKFGPKMQHIDEEKMKYDQLICAAVQVCPRHCRLIRLNMRIQVSSAS
ncbi:hypothetical protein VNO80_20512 [Phaseolus coccineus]|uniref:Uncharacterized protein n=1 Tax=Phaseolus coccineus TaxID=3886 RepID=A0AAN9M4F2_PHACN